MADARRIAKYLLRGRADIAGDLEDIVQEGATRAWLRFDPKLGTWRTWLYRCMQVAVFDAQRAHQRHQRPDRSWLWEPPTPLQRLLVDELVEQVLEGITPFEFAAALTGSGAHGPKGKHSMRGPTQRDLAERYGLSKSQVWRRSSAALDRMREQARYA